MIGLPARSLNRHYLHNSSRINFIQAIDQAMNSPEFAALAEGATVNLPLNNNVFSA
jgi:hypothetical protein